MRGKLDTTRNPLFWKFLSAFLILAIVGLLSIYIILPEGSQDLLPVSVQYLAATGTLSLAAGTFYNIQQTNRDLRLREQKREKPLAIDEMSNIIVPAIEAVSDNIEDVRNGEEIDWVYVDGPSSFSTLGRPRSAMPVNDVAALQRLNEQHRELYHDLVKHDEMIRQMGQLAQEIFEGVHDSVKIQIEEAGYSDDDYSQSDKVFVSAMLKRVDEFGKSHEMYDFWEENRESLLEILDEEASESVQELEKREEKFEMHCENLIEELVSYQAEVQREFGISSDELDEISRLD